MVQSNVIRGVSIYVSLTIDVGFRQSFFADNVSFFEPDSVARDQSRIFEGTFTGQNRIKRRIFFGGDYGLI